MHVLQNASIHSIYSRLGSNERGVQYLYFLLLHNLYSNNFKALT
jgi:hypothetical protein